MRLAYLEIAQIPCRSIRHTVISKVFEKQAARTPIEVPRNTQKQESTIKSQTHLYGETVEFDEPAEPVFPHPLGLTRSYMGMHLQYIGNEGEVNT